MDYTAHNEQVKEVWESYHHGTPIRTPMILGVNIRCFFTDPSANTEGMDFERYSNDPAIMFDYQLRFQEWLKLTLPQDAEMGYPQKGWSIGVDLQNYYEAAWLGCELHYHKGQVPDTEPMLDGDKKNRLFDKGIPGPFDGLMQKNLHYYESFQKIADGYLWRGLPVKNISPSGLGTDGPLTVATSLRGSELYTDFYEDPDYVKELLNLITEAVIMRIKAWRRYLGRPEKSPAFGFADDSIQLISEKTYREFVLPCHRRLVEELGQGERGSIHLCGDATRHFKNIRNELNVYSFDTGFPVDFAALRAELGPEVEILGGPQVEFLRRATPDQVREEVLRILDSGIREGGKFILREGNNLAPGTPLENIQMMYDTVCRVTETGLC
jgi:hypothetical protein